MSHETIREMIAAQCKDRTPESVLDILAEHTVIAADAKARIDTEGTVVRTMKGDVIQHPAIRVHADATKIIASLMEKWGSGRRP